jgi:DNA-binding LytR/AlgR family response regulator
VSDSPAVSVPDVPSLRITDRITVRIGTRLKIIPLETIMYIQSDGDYISIRTSEGRYLKEQTMKYTEDILPSSHFLRIHRSYIINLTYISRIEREGDRQSIILSNNEKIKISAARYQALKRWLDI